VNLSTSLRGAKRRSNPALACDMDCFAGGACHRARIRATRWLLAMTALHERNTNYVVPANAGTHHPWRRLFWTASTASLKTRAHGVWVPAFAGTTELLHHADLNGWNKPPHLPSLLLLISRAFEEFCCCAVWGREFSRGCCIDAAVGGCQSGLIGGR
jgi:hypothetical protein